jgi:hypothetical protein
LLSDQNSVILIDQIGWQIWLAELLFYHMEEPNTISKEECIIEMLDVIDIFCSICLYSICQRKSGWKVLLETLTVLDILSKKYSTTENLSIDITRELLLSLMGSVLSLLEKESPLTMVFFKK